MDIAGPAGVVTDDTALVYNDNNNKHETPLDPPPQSEPPPSMVVNSARDKLEDDISIGGATAPPNNNKVWNKVRWPLNAISSLLGDNVRCDPAEQHAIECQHVKHHHQQQQQEQKSELELEALHLDPNGHKQKFVLSTPVAEKIREQLPMRLKTQDSWKLIYSLHEDGSSLATLFSYCRKNHHLCGERHGYLLVVESLNNQKFGAFSSEYFHPSPRYYGNGECFVWSLNHEQPDESKQFKAYSFTGKNEFMVFSSMEFLSIGGSEGNFGLWLDRNLCAGTTSSCATFDNEPLILGTGASKVDFGILQVEVWLIY